MPLCPICNINSDNKYCSATDVEYFTTTETFDFFRCDACGVLFIHPMPVDLLSVIYPANYYSFTSKSDSLTFKLKDFIDSLFYKKIMRQIPGDKIRVLDIGGGNGTLLDSVKKADKRVSFTQIVDLDANAKSIAESKGHNYYQGIIENFEDNNLYDVILMLNLIEHVSNPLNVLTKASKLLSASGVIIIKTPNYKSLDATVFKDIYWGGLHCPRHWVLFTKDSFSKVSDLAGLQTKKFSYTQGAPFWGFSILHWMHKKKWITANKEKPIIYHPLFTIISIVAAGFDFIRKPFAPLSQMFFVLTKKNN
jgi:SAM-dependent methyltransferase